MKIEPLKSWTLYSFEDPNHTFGYTILLPVNNYFVDRNDHFKFQGWMLYTNDSKVYVIDSKFGLHLIDKKQGDIDPEEDYFELDKYHRDVLSNISNHIQHDMIRDLFEKDIKKLNP